MMSRQLARAASVATACLILATGSAAFAPRLGLSSRHFIVSTIEPSTTLLEAAKGKKRRRKTSPQPDATNDAPTTGGTAKVENVLTSLETPMPAPTVPKEVPSPIANQPTSSMGTVAGKSAMPEAISDAELAKDDDDDELSNDDLSELASIANFKFKADSDLVKGVQNEDLAMQDPDAAIPLPDIKQARKKKEMDQEQARTDAEIEDQRVRIKRSDKVAFRNLLESIPFADADDSYFEEEKYTVVSALLGEGAKPFLGIPTGPLQVGHFIGALVILLMGFVEYPGFPLTNLPSPLRGALQGGLGTVYAINTVLAVLAAFKAPERGQPIPLWVAKTFSVGGLAYDQLTQLPTLEEIEKAKAVKGARALKNKKRKR